MHFVLLLCNIEYSHSGSGKLSLHLMTDKEMLEHGKNGLRGLERISCYLCVILNMHIPAPLNFLSHLDAGHLTCSNWSTLFAWHRASTPGGTRIASSR